MMPQLQLPLQLQPFDKLLQAHIKNPKDRFKGILLALDPGETTGSAIFQCTEDSTSLIAHEQLVCTPIEQGIDTVSRKITSYKFDHIVYEDYKVYSWKSSSHSWSSLHTPQLLGVINTIARQQHISISHQMAQEAKEFCDDQKLHTWGSYIKGQRHSRDAIRHGLFYLLFRYRAPKISP